MKRWQGRGALAMIALLCAGSGALRLGFGAGAALALVPDQGATEAAGLCSPPPAAVAQALTEREALLADREAALADRMAALALAEKAVQTRMAEMAEARDSLMQVVAVADGAAEKDLSRLTAVYEAMKPADAARLFAAMSPDFAAGFLGRMRPETAAAVMAALDPKAAYGISALIAGRNANAPTD
ncbi:hypothetical protein HYN69_17755 [Gemmobacter aquarius]|uniref:Magnesium transporter MgtE intracellular domain-containing protein n=1 Tax=Paragemmobacter aquarius TaxID=2169400 RepID=A0A2S0UQL3_9RHOB|nr:hypothetical protein [Gemmobacter aquarius]AWB50104.1 hypothetical protein HYN69_17755 [Gemmobacter aquarius]